MKETRFKDTEIGRIPEDWEVKRLEEVCEFRNGYTPSKAVSSYWNNGTIPWFRMEDIRTNGHILFDSILHVTPQAIKGGLFPKNSIILSTTATIGEHALIIADSLANQQFTNLIIRKSLKNKLDISYFYWYCYILGEWCRNNINQGGLAAVNMPNLYNLQVPIPTNEEQSRIASALTSIDNLIASLDKLIEKKKNIKQGTMQQLLTGKKRLKGFTEPWVEKRIIDSFKFLGNNTFSRDELSDTGLVRNVHYGDVLIQYGATIDASRDVLPFVIGRETVSHPLKDGDIIMADTAEDETCGKVCEIRGIGDSLIEAGLHTIALRPNDEYGRWFLGYYMNSSAFHDLLIPLMQGTKVTSISKSALLNVRMMIPSVKAEQTAIAKVLSAMDNDIIALKSRKAKYESIKQGMMQQLLSGKIRLIKHS